MLNHSAAPRIATHLADPASPGKFNRQLARELGIHESLIRRFKAQPENQTPMPATQSPAKSPPKVETVKLVDLVLDKGLQPRAVTNSDALVEYRLAYQNKGDLGLIIVF